MNVQTTDTFLEGYGIKCLLTGASGSGKTRSLLSLKEAGYKPLMVSAESGVLSLRGSGIPMIDISRSDKGEALLPEKRPDRLYEVFSWLKAGQKDYDTVFLDSLTEVNDVVIAALKKKHTDQKDTLKLYMENMEIMMRLAREFRDLQYNVVLVALSEVEKDDVGRRYTTASVVGKVAARLPALFDEVINLQVVENEKKEATQRFQCKPTSDIVCKDRSGQLAMYEPYDLGKLFRKIEGKK